MCPLVTKYSAQPSHHPHSRMLRIQQPTHRRVVIMLTVHGRFTAHWCSVPAPGGISGGCYACMQLALPAWQARKNSENALCKQIEASVAVRSQLFHLYNCQSRLNKQWFVVNLGDIVTGDRNNLKGSFGRHCSRLWGLQKSGVSVCHATYRALHHCCFAA